MTRAFRSILWLGLLLPALAREAGAQGQVECLQIRSTRVECDATQPGKVTVTFQLQNGSAFPIDRLFLWGQAGLTATPDEHIFAPVPPGALSGVLTVMLDLPPAPAAACLELSIHNSETGECCSRRICPTIDCGGQPEIIRGDANLSARVDISDAVKILSYLFVDGIGTTCLKTMDADDRGTIDITDAIYILAFLFLGGPELPPPGSAACGPDPTSDNLQCEVYPHCG